MAATTARIETLSRGLNRSAGAAAELPAAVRNETGVDDERLATLRERANELSGPEVAAIARGVAGEGVGGPIGNGRGPPGNETDRGPPEDAGPPGNGTDRGPPEDAGPPEAGGPSATDPENKSTGRPGERPGNGSGGPPEGDTENGSAEAPGRNGASEENGASPGEAAGGSGSDGMNRSEGAGERGTGSSDPGGEGASGGGEPGNGSGGPSSEPGDGSNDAAAALSGVRPAGVRSVAVSGSP